MEDELKNYWENIKKNIKLLKEGLLKGKRGYITKRYNYNAFCNHFIPEPKAFEVKNNQCICGHYILINFRYVHRHRPDEYLIVGSCCIKKFSAHYKEKRTCLDCNIKIKYHKSNRCKQCRLNVFECKICNLYLKPEDKHKHCKRCKKEIDSKYYFCYKCNMANKVRL
jgi:hypothetical protein